MKFAVVLTAVLAACASTQASLIPAEHHGRFLQERDQLETELAAWKSSKAGQFALKNGFYKDDATSLDSLDNQLSRFFLTKLNIEDVQKQNPDAKFSVYTPFALMTNEEFAKYVRKSSHGLTALRSSANATATDALPAVRQLRAEATSKDWTTGTCVAPIKDQGQCGSCWAFSVISVLESAYCLKHGSLTQLSEQQLVSCDHSDYGCDGGLQSTALAYIKKNGGVATESSYPYTSGYTEVDGSCTTSGHTKFPVTITSIKLVTPTDAGFVAGIDITPISVSVAAGNPSWKQYTGGVVSSCSTSELDHAVVAVGYDSTSFKIRNSWGEDWGENGYIRLKRISSSKAACNVINSDATYPVVA